MSSSAGKVDVRSVPDQICWANKLCALRGVDCSCWGRIVCRYGEANRTCVRSVRVAASPSARFVVPQARCRARVGLWTGPRRG